MGLLFDAVVPGAQPVRAGARYGREPRAGRAGWRADLSASDLQWPEQELFLLFLRDVTRYRKRATCQSHGSSAGPSIPTRTPPVAAILASPKRPSCSADGPGTAPTAGLTKATSQPSGAAGRPVTHAPWRSRCRIR